MGRFLGITVYKSWPRVGASTDTLKNPTKCLWRWDPDRRSNFFFSLPAHLCAVTYIVYDWNIVDCDVKQPIHLTFTKDNTTKACVFPNESKVSDKDNTTQALIFPNVSQYYGIEQYYTNFDASILIKTIPHKLGCFLFYTSHSILIKTIPNKFGCFLTCPSILIKTIPPPWGPGG